MTKMLNMVTVLAVLVRDPELTYVGQGTPKVSLTLGGEREVTRDGQVKRLPFYLPATQLGKGAEFLAERNLRAGDGVLAICALDYESWGSDDGKRSKVGLKVLRVEALEGGFEVTRDAGGGLRMQGGFAEVTLAGKLTRDAELRYTPSGDAVVSLGLAVNETYTDRGGAAQTKVHFVDVTVWRELAEAHKDLRKGASLLVRGSAVNESWVDKDDKKRSTVKVEASLVQVLARAERAEGQVKREGAAKRELVAASAATPAAQPAKPARSGGLDIDQGLQDFPPVEDDLPF